MAKPYLIVTSEKVSKEYLDYLDRQNISWIACVKEHVDLARATEILAEQFGVERTLLHSRVEGADIFLDYLSDQSKSMSVLYRTQIS